MHASNGAAHVLPPQPDPVEEEEDVVEAAVDEELVDDDVLDDVVTPLDAAAPPVPSGTVVHPTEDMTRAMSKVARTIGCHANVSVHARLEHRPG